MDDHTTRQQIDELADLYLTSVIDQQGNPPTDETPNPIEGPEPIKLAPKLGGDPAPKPPEPELTLTEQADEHHDRHPVLRLTDSQSDHDAEPQHLQALATLPAPDAAGDELDNTADSEPTPTEPAPRAMLEAVFMGNLPGMSGPWLTQYAQLLAQTEGPVAILHVAENAIDLELVEPRAEAEPSPAMPTASVRIPPMRGNKTGLVGLLDALVCSEKAPTRTVLVRMEDASADAQALSRLAAMDDWTLLCGSDDTSVAAASHQLRTLVRADPRLADRNVGLMVMGSDEAASRTAATRVAQDLEHDLVHPVEFIGHLKRMQPVQVREIASFTDPVGVWPQLVSWFDSLLPPEPIATPQRTPVAAKPSPAPTSIPEASTPSSSAPRPALSPVAEKIAASAAASSAPGSSRPTPMPTFRTAPPRARQAPTAEVQAEAKPAAEQPRQRAPQRPAAAPRAAAPQAPSKPQSTPQRTAAEAAPPVVATQPMRSAPQKRVLSPQPELDLVALIGQGHAALDDPATLEARIPDQPDAQLAVDAHGIVHILLNKGTVPFNGGEVASDDPRSAVMQLIEAGRWVSDNLELLALTQRDRTFTDHPPVLHLLTDRPDHTTRLVGKLSGQVTLHLLQQVQLGRETGWFCTPLG